LSAYRSRDTAPEQESAIDGAQPGVDAAAPVAQHFDEHERLAGLVHAFIAMMHAGNIARLDVQHGDLRLSLRAHETSTSAGVAPRQEGAVVVPPIVTDHVPAPADDKHYVITAPMIGTFYISPAPSDPPFVEPGDRVEEGQTVGIIEAMKIMNEIAADRAGVVVEVLATNAQTVEYGSPLVKLALDHE
jgi:acetyl-CoA carboxylase biotin carboxyl carrier protein